ncbi:MAG: lactate racemase domain-containing protein [Candidatus Helarchaeota archaeon]
MPIIDVKLPWGAWTDSNDYVLSFPDSWEVATYPIRNANDISQEKVREAILNPIGTKAISELATRKKTAAIVVDDLTRLTPAGRIVPFIIQELAKADITKKNIVIIIALGAHRPLTRADMIKKLGEPIVNSMNIQNHHPYENLVDLGTTEIGTPIHVNKTYYEADVKIAVSGVIPHPLAGYGGGAKIILPGICGIETLEANHRIGMERGSGLGYVTKAREDIEETAKIVGLDYSINVILTMRGGIAGVFAGNYIEAHRSAIKLGNKVYATKTPTPGIDIGICNLYPEDSELNQALKGFNFILTSKKFLKREATIVFTSACTEGRGYHSLLAERGARLFTNWGNHIIFKAVIGRKRHFAFFSPNLNKFDIELLYPETTIFSNTWENMVKHLRELHGDEPRVAIFPCSIQVPEK